MTKKKVLILYSSTDGHTIKICMRLKDTIEKTEAVTLAPIDADIDLQEFDKIVIGASIRYGHHSPKVFKFIQDNHKLLNSKLGAFFSVNLTARKPNKNTPETNAYCRKFLKKISWKPTMAGVFAGKVNYPKYKFHDRIMIQFIMWMMKGPTDPKAVIEFTDWDKVDEFGHDIQKL